LVAFHREVYPGLREKGLTLLTVSNDVRESDLRDFLEEHALPFPVYFDPYAKLRDRLAILGVPGTAILGRDGHLVDRLFGEQDWQSPALRERFEKYVEE
jgi:peroxiredoxin